jgi:hypothetical protein
MTDRLAVIVPTRGRPDNIQKVLAAWDFTGAWADADLVLAVDGDDPEYPAYAALYDEHVHPDTNMPLFSVHVQDRWVPMVSKLNTTALGMARGYSAIAFAGDDHLPRTIGWARRYLDVLAELGSGMVYGDDGFQGANLATEWAVTADCVRALGRMVPAPVDHLYCDNAMMDLFGGAGALRHLPEIRIEHVNPFAGKGEWDKQYKRVNSREQYRTDGEKYKRWKDRPSGLFADVAVIRELRGGRPDERPVRVHQAGDRTMSIGSGPRKVSSYASGGGRGRQVQRSGPRAAREPKPPATEQDITRWPFPRHFKNIVGATPPEIEVTLADFAAQVPGDQEIVELGVYQGRTAIIMAWGASLGRGAHVTAIDAWDLPGNSYDPPFTLAETRKQAEYNVGSVGYGDRIDLVQSFAIEVARDYAHEAGMGPVRPVGLLFVDDDHSYEGAKGAILTWAPHLAEGAIIAVDDYGHPDWPGVKQAVDELAERGILSSVEIYHERLAVAHLAQVPAGETITAITSEGVIPAPQLTLDHDMTLEDLREEAKIFGIKHAGVMGEAKLRMKLREAKA